RPLDHGSEGAGRGGAQSALGACDQLRDRRLDQRPCRNLPNRRGRACHLPLGSLAGCPRIVGHRAERSQGQPMGERAMEGRVADLAGTCTAAAAGDRGKGARNGVTGAMAHSFNRWAWSQATFAVAGQVWTADIDALAVRRGAGKYMRIDRSSVKFPPTNLNRSGPTYTALCGSVVRTEIDRGTGALRSAKAYIVLECGQALVPQLVLGQARGGFAMGVGYALLESLPLYEMDRAMGNGTSINTVSHGDRTCRSTGSRLRYVAPDE